MTHPHRSRFRHALLLALALVASSTAMLPTPVHADAPAEASRVIDVVVEGGYRPARILIDEGERVRLRFVRRDYGPCTREIVFPQLGIRRTLPTNETVVVDLPALAAGEYDFHCGMRMIHGTLVVTPA